MQARCSFEPVLDSLRVRTVHVMKRLFGVVEHMLKADGMQMSETHQKPFSEFALFCSPSPGAKYLQ